MVVAVPAWVTVWAVLGAYADSRGMRTGEGMAMSGAHTLFVPVALTADGS